LDLIGAASLVGVFVGRMFFGYHTDRIGRRFMYIADVRASGLFSILSAFGGEAWELVILRLLLGVATGADCPIAISLLAECSPKLHPASLLGAIFVFWVIPPLAGRMLHHLAVSADLFEPLGR